MALAHPLQNLLEVAVITQALTPGSSQSRWSKRKCAKVGRRAPERICHLITLSWRWLPALCHMLWVTQTSAGPMWGQGDVHRGNLETAAQDTVLHVLWGPHACLCSHCASWPPHTFPGPIFIQLYEALLTHPSSVMSPGILESKFTYMFLSLHLKPLERRNSIVSQKLNILWQKCFLNLCLYSSGKNPGTLWLFTF